MTTDAANYLRLREAVGELLHVAELHGDTRKRPPCCDIARRRDAAWAAMRVAYDAATIAPALSSAGAIRIGLIETNDTRSLLEQYQSHARMGHQEGVSYWTGEAACRGFVLAGWDMATGMFTTCYIPADDAPGGGNESEGDGKTNPFAP